MTPAAPASCYDLLGTTFQVDCQSGELTTMLDGLLGPFSCPSRPVPGARHFRLVVDEGGAAVHRLSRDGRIELQTEDVTELMEHLMASLNLEAIDGFDGFAAHAGVIAMDGKATAFPAASGEGKSSLVAAALLAGFDYVSDEALCVEFASCAVVPYPRPLGLSFSICEALGLTATRPHLAAPTAKAIVAPSDLGPTTAPGPLALADIVGLRRLLSPRKATLVEMPRHQAALWLLQRSFNHYKRPTESFELVGELAGRARAWCLDYHDSRDAASLLRDRLDASR